MMTRHPDIRATDKQRDAALAELSLMLKAGCLDPDEHEQRADDILRSKTCGQLEAVVADLPIDNITSVQPSRRQIRQQQRQQRRENKKDSRWSAFQNWRSTMAGQVAIRKWKRTVLPLVVFGLAAIPLFAGILSWQSGLDQRVANETSQMDRDHAAEFVQTESDYILGKTWDDNEQTAPTVNMRLLVSRVNADLRAEFSSLRVVGADNLSQVQKGQVAIIPDNHYPNKESQDFVVAARSTTGKLSSETIANPMASYKLTGGSR